MSPICLDCFPGQEEVVALRTPFGRGRVLALFDFDGTITTREMLPDFVRYAVPKWRLRVGGALLMPVVLAYRAGMVSGMPRSARRWRRACSKASRRAVQPRYSASRCSAMGPCMRCSTT